MNGPSHGLVICLLSWWKSPGAFRSPAPPLPRSLKEGNDFFIVEEGEVICTKRDGAGGEMEVSDPLGPGSYFGELALLTDDLRKATVRALSPVRVLAVDRATFNRILGSLRESLKTNMEMYEKYVDEKK